MDRNTIDPKYKWRTEDLFETDKAWEETYNKLNNDIDKFSDFKGRVTESAKTLLECLKLYDELCEVLNKLYVYSNLCFHIDSRDTFYHTLADKADMILVKFSSETSFIVPEITKLDEETLKSYMNEEEGLKIYAHEFDTIMRKKAHTLSVEVEGVLAKTSDISSAADNIFAMINDADMVFPDILNKDGEKLPLTKGNYIMYLESSDRVLRENAFNALYDTYLKQKNTIAATYYESVKKDVFYSKIRNYKSSMSMALADDNIPEKVYDNLIETVRKNLGLMHRYVKLRKKLLGLDEIHMYDLYTPLVKDVDMKITYEEAKEKVIEGLKPLGENYIETLKSGLSGGWIDVYETPGKRGGAYSWGAYPGHPYVLLNHKDNINSTFTLAHEMGHALHSYFTWEKQPFVYSGHKIFVAEVASTVNEALLMQHMIKNAEDKKLKKYLINHFLEQFRGTFFRQTMFAEFEKITHENVEKGEPLNVDILNKIYRDLNLAYFGEDIIVDDRIDIEWARIPHFYNAFYVYQYATGYSCAIALSQKILEEGEEAVVKYLDFLSKGNSEYSIDLLKGAGVDMTQKEPIEAAISVFEKLLDEFEEELE